MTHLYTSRKFARRTGGQDKYKIHCTNEWREAIEFKVGPYGRQQQLSFTTVPKCVTCPKCLEKLIPKAEAELNLMRQNLQMGLAQYPQLEFVSEPFNAASVPEPPKDNTELILPHGSQ